MNKTRIISLMMIMMITMTGCYNVDWYKENPDDVASEELMAVLDDNDFNVDNWEYTAYGTWGNILIDGPEIQNISWEYKDYKGKYLDLNYSGLAKINGDFTAEAISEFYYADYILNDYIFDQKYGNNLKEFFVKQDELGIDYYISQQRANGISTNDMVEQSRYKGTSACTTNFGEEEKQEKIINYIGSSNLDKIEWESLIDELSCEIYIQIYYDESNLREVGVTLDDIKKEVKQYYNDEYININLELFDWDNESVNYFIMDSNYGEEKTGQVMNQESLIDKNYIYEWD